MRLYVASSWRNERFPDVLEQLREAGHECYDFRNPSEGDRGFSWREIEPAINDGFGIKRGFEDWTIPQYIEALSHPIAERGFSNDWNGMLWADAGVLVLPCGRSAHIEAGYFVGAGKPLLILLAPMEPELMYKMADSIHSDVEGVVARLAELQPFIPPFLPVCDCGCPQGGEHARDCARVLALREYEAARDLE